MPRSSSARLVSLRACSTALLHSSVDPSNRSQLDPLVRSPAAEIKQGLAFARCPHPRRAGHPQCSVADDDISERLCALGHCFSPLEHRNEFDVAVRASSAAHGSRLRTHAWQRISDHVSLAHLLSASASWWAIRGVIPIHSTGVPNARMTLPPLAVTAYRSSPSSSGVRAPWVNLPVSPSGVPWARVSAFIAWIVSATFACCTASLNHRSPWCSSSCIMVSIRARSLDVSSVELASAMPKRAVDSAYTCAKPPSTNNSVAVT